jgi:hypothetical protein
MMGRVLICVFGAYGQVVVGALMVTFTIAETLYWEYVTPPTLNVVFLVSMEALLFAGYAVVATGLAVLWLNKRTPDA